MLEFGVLQKWDAGTMLEPYVLHKLGCGNDVRTPCAAKNRTRERCSNPVYCKKWDAGTMLEPSVLQKMGCGNDVRTACAAKNGTRERCSNLMCCKKWDA